jgi:cathepsin L
MVSAVFFLALAVAVSARVRWHELHEDFSFDDYLDRHPKAYARGSSEYMKRKALFDAKLQDILAHNNDPSMSWKKGLNEWSDLSDEEFVELFGKKTSPKATQSQAMVQEDQDEEEHDTIDAYFKGLPKSVDWVKAGRNTAVHSQCGGSCWAHTTAEMLESGLAKTYRLKNDKIPQISVQEVMACTPNPRHCGGKGGCKGATVELAMKWVNRNGLSLVDNFALGDAKHHAAQFCPCVDSKQTCINKLADKKRVKVKARSFATLPKNKFFPLLKAVTKGPVAISVGTQDWGSYDSGVLSCGSSPNTVIGHAVLLVGYGRDPMSGKRYWKVRNSWGPNWGEDGYVRLEMRHNEHKFCGVNNKPHEGTGCDGGPKSVPVCGTCGIMFDSVVAKGVHIQDHRGRKLSRNQVLRLGKKKKHSFMQEESEEEEESESEDDSEDA